MIKSINLFIFTALFSSLTYAQSTYYSGFDSETEQDGWTEYKTAATTFSHWEFSTTGAFSPATCIHHDYSPATGITITDNWFVSPIISLSEGGTLDSIRYKFSGLSTPEESDTIAIYLLLGSQNPDLADSKELLFDFRNDDYINDYTYHLLPEITLPTSTDDAYIAIRYLNSDCSSKWLTTSFDNIGISYDGELSIDNNDSDNINFSVYPNPTKDLLTIQSIKSIESLVLYDVFGSEIIRSTTNSALITKIDLSNIPNGVYLIQLLIDGTPKTKKIIVQH